MCRFYKKWAAETVLKAATENAVSKETVADGGKVLPYMAFKNVVIAGK